MNAHTCGLPDCANPHHAKGYCLPHYKQAHSGTPAAKPSARPCDEPDCPYPHWAKGKCHRHYNAAYRDANPWTPKVRAPEPSSKLPASWSQPAPRHTAPSPAVGKALPEVVVGAPLERAALAQAVAVLANHDALDLVEMLGIREMAAETRGAA